MSHHPILIRQGALQNIILVKKNPQVDTIQTAEKQDKFRILTEPLPLRSLDCLDPATLGQKLLFLELQ